MSCWDCPTRLRQERAIPDLTCRVTGASLLYTSSCRLAVLRPTDGRKRKLN